MRDIMSSDDTNHDQIASTPRVGRHHQIGWGVALLAGGAFSGAILAGNLPAFAGDTSSPSPSSTSGGTTTEGRAQGGDGHQSETALTGSTAAKVKAAALAKVPGAAVDRLEKDADGAEYEAHLTKADGSRVTVKLNAKFAVTGVETGGPGEQNWAGRGHDEAALTGSAATKVRAAALARVPGSTVDRVEKDADGATYEAHVTKPDGTEATVKLDKNFRVTGVESGR
jgi:uncharacterized membrane protein YkoI